MVAEEEDVTYLGGFIGILWYAGPVCTGWVDGDTQNNNTAKVINYPSPRIPGKS